MPELPEVETIRLGLKKLITGKQIKTIKHDRDKSFPNPPDLVKKYLIGAKIKSIRRRGKGLIIDLDSGYSLAIHLKMTGQIVYRGDKNFGAGHPTNSLVGKLPDKSTRVEITFSGGDKLYFNDQRKFGWMKLIPTDELLNQPFFSRLGPEPLSKSFKPRELADRIKKRTNSRIKTVLLDQAVVSGIGNIYADEILFLAKLHPETRVANISDNKLRQLHPIIVDVLNLSISSGGSTDRNYVDASGNKGSYLNFAKVFRREGQACLDCQQIITKIKVAGRGTHICINCQKLVL